MHVDTQEISLLTSMAPYLKTVTSFADVRITEAGVDTVTFLSASEGMVRVFGLLGGIVAHVEPFLDNHIKAIRRCYESRPDDCRTLESLARYDLQRDCDGANNVVYLLRGLDLTCNALTRMRSDSSQALSDCFRQSCDDVLGPHFNFFSMIIVKIALSVVPSREEFYSCVSQGLSNAEVNMEIDKSLEGARILIERMHRFYRNGGFGKSPPGW